MNWLIKPAWLFPALGSLFLGARAEKAQQPNIIFFLADDMRWDAMRCAGNEWIETPALDALAAQGVRFDNAFVTTSICCCSRASILSGQYVSRHGIPDFKTPFGPEAFAQTYPTLLKDAGYQIGFVGKYGIGTNTNDVAPRFDYFFGSAEQPKYKNTDENGNYIHYEELVEKHICQFLSTTSTDKPFCLSVSFKAPHVQDGDPRQFIYNPKYKDLYTDVKMPETKTNTLDEWEKFPEFFKKDNEARKRWELRFSNPEQFQESVKGYYRLIKGLDEVIGNIREKLGQMGIAENTILIFSGDNGFYLGEHGLAGKWYGHEPSIRVPLIICNPKHKELAGKVVSKMALNIDIAPTILSFAGIRSPKTMQGRDLKLIMANGKPSDWRNSFYYEHNVPIKTIPKSQGLRTGKYMYIVYPESSPVYEELYDLQNDPAQQNNLAPISGNNALLKKIRSEFRKKQKESIGFK
ncbi:MAG: sulfatase [Prolixibacteraceae bacterium]|jgi:arylsulfatase A-like enzyme|nr:sulfatase [Prolixibacteraceae bacterium]